MKDSPKGYFLFFLIPAMIATGCFEEEVKVIDDHGLSYASEYFSWSVAMDGDFAVIGAPEAYNSYNIKTGAVTVYWRDDNGDWTTYPNRLAPSNLEDDDYFGFSVAIDGDTLIVGASGEDNHAGAAYVYRRYGFGRNQNLWYQEARLIASDRANYDNFGFAVSISGNRAVVAADTDDNYNGTNAGGVYVYEYNGNSWPQMKKIVASDGAANDNFGFSVAISGGVLAIGSPYDDNGKGTDAGAAYLYTGSGSSWSQDAKLTASDGAANDFFGDAIDINGNQVIVGAWFDDNQRGTNAGAAYFFVRNASSWSQVSKLMASDGAGSDGFGRSVSITDDIVAVGAPYNDAMGSNSGAAYVYLQMDNSLYYLEKLTASDAALADLFGYSVAVDGNYAVFGAPYDENSNGAFAGAAYIFEAQQ